MHQKINNDWKAHLWAQVSHNKVGYQCHQVDDAAEPVYAKPGDHVRWGNLWEVMDSIDLLFLKSYTTYE